MLVLKMQCRTAFIPAMASDQHVSGSSVENPSGEGDEGNVSFSLNEFARLFFILHHDEWAKSALQSVRDEMNRFHLDTRVMRERHRTIVA